MDLPVNDIIKPMLPQAKVNKCLIALVSSKVVMKAQVGVSILSMDSVLVSVVTSHFQGVSQYTFVGVTSQR